MLKKVAQAGLFIFFLVFSSLQLTSFLKSGFKVQKILFPKDFSDPDISFISKDFKVSQVLNQPFRYLGKGRQCFVFESKDYVIKFLRYDRVAEPFYLLFVPNKFALNKFVPNWFIKNSLKKQTFSQWIKSYQLAFDSLSNEAALVYAKLNFTDTLPSKIILLDPLGNKINLNLKNCFFFIQKKVTPLDELFINLKNQNNLSKIQTILDSFFDTVSLRMRKNIQNKTTSCFHNVGWLGNKIVEFDIGDLIINEDFQNEKVFQQHFMFFTSPLREWLAREIPELVEYFDKRQESTLQKNLLNIPFN